MPKISNNILTLPTEIHQNILSHLDIGSLLNFSMTRETANNVVIHYALSKKAHVKIIHFEEILVKNLSTYFMPNFIRQIKEECYDDLSLFNLPLQDKSDCSFTQLDIKSLARLLVKAANNDLSILTTHSIRKLFDNITEFFREADDDRYYSVEYTECAFTDLVFLIKEVKQLEKILFPHNNGLISDRLNDLAIIEFKSYEKNAEGKLEFVHPDDKLYGKYPL